MKAVITGGASGIGLAIGRHLSEQGHEVILVDLDGQAAQQAAATLANGRGLALDVTDAGAVTALARELGAVDILINNAGIQHVAALEDFPAEKWQQLVNIMLVGPALLIQALLPAMKAQDFGRIINIGSIHSLVASPYKSAYVAAKHGLLGLAKTLALELGQADITVNTLCPAYVKTPLVEKQIADQARANGISEAEVIDSIMLAPMPKKAFIGLDEITGTVDFLLSPAARNMTAQALVLDGGWTAR